MKERPIIFTAESVRAILAGTKTQTRRVVKPQPLTDVDEFPYWWAGAACSNERVLTNLMLVNCAYGRPGDRLWVKETWLNDGTKRTPVVHYRADNTTVTRSFDGHWKGPRFMPRVASRLTLEITGVRVERVQEIGAIDALYEGIVKEYFLPDPDNFHPPGTYGFVTGLHEFPGGKIHVHPQQAYQELWDTINAKRGFGWDNNPWVWVIEFRRVP